MTPLISSFQQKNVISHYQSYESLLAKQSLTNSCRAAIFSKTGFIPIGLKTLDLEAATMKCVTRGQHLPL